MANQRLNYLNFCLKNFLLFGFSKKSFKEIEREQLALDS